MRRLFGSPLRPGSRSAASAALSLLLASGTAAALDSRAFVTTTDYTTGQLRRVDLDGPTVMPGAAGVCADTRLRWHGGRLWVIGRLGCDNLQVVDPATLTTVHQFSTGNGSNPYDVAFANGHVYVACYGLASILILDPDTGAGLGSISLSEFADSDGIPEADHMELYGPWLFVSCERLDRNHNFQPNNPALVAVVDTRADTVFDADPTLPGKQAIPLTGRNPVTPFVLDPTSGRFLLGCAGRYQALDGGIEWIDPVQMKSLGYAITESALGGDVNAIAFSQPTRSYAIVSDVVSFNTSLVSFNAATGARIGTLLDTGEFSLSDIALDDRGELWAANLSFTTPGLYAWRAGPDTLIAGPLATGLPPSQITFDRATGEVSVAGGPIPGFHLSAPRPNPARSVARFTIGAAPGTPIEATIHDVAGRCVRRLGAATAAGQPTQWTWDLASDRGTPVAAGVYFVRVRAGAALRTRAVIVSR